VQASDVDEVAPLTLAHRAGGSGQSGTGSSDAVSSSPDTGSRSTQSPNEPHNGRQALAVGSPTGTWGELPPRPAGIASIKALGAWPPKA
jgi:hypothetical protein